MGVTPFRIKVPEIALLDLRERLARTRWPHAIPGSDWRYGLDFDYMRTIRDYWIEKFDWRRHEAEWNLLPQYRFSVDGAGIHFIHVKGRGPAPLPLIITHGWPGSFLEMLKLV